MPGGMLAFVGREHELAELAAAAREAHEGRGGLWLLSGEPGIGKSRLADEAAREAQRGGAVALWGRAWEAGGAPAYWPWIQVLRGALREMSEQAVARTRVAQLGQLLPEHQAERAAGPPPLAPEQARFQLLDAVWSVLHAAAAEAPLFVVLEDLHSADTSSLLLLDFVARQARSAGVVLVGTFREVEARASESGALLLRIAREARTLPLTRLAPGDVRRFVAGLAGEEQAAAGVVDAIHGRTEGNPLFVVELARLLLAHGHLRADAAGAIPPTVRTVIGERLRGVDRGVREILELAAVVGRDVDAGRLAALFERDPAHVRAALAAAEGAALVLQVGPDTYRFSHILIREVLHDDIDAPTRHARHAAVGHGLAALGEGDPATPWSEIAHHLLEAGEDAREEAVDAAMRAAAQARAALAFEAAVSIYRDALAALGPADRALRCRLLTGLGEAELCAGDVERGRATGREAIALARELGAAPLARAALAYGSLLHFARVDPELVAALEEAAERLGAGHSALEARVLARLAAARQPAPDPRGPIALAHEAIEMARRSGDRGALLAALRYGCSAMMDLEAPAVRRPINREHVELAEALGDDAEAFRGHLRCAVDSFELADMAGAAAAIAGVRRIAARLDHPALQWRVRALDAADALWAGRFEEAAAAIAEARALGERAGDPNARDTATYQRVRLYRLTGQEVELAAVLPELEALWRGTPVAESVCAVMSAAQLALLGRTEEAAAGLARTSVDTAMSDRTLHELLAELAAAAGDRALAEQLIERLEPHADELVSGGVIGMTRDGPVARALALAHRTVGHHDVALSYLERGIDASAALGGEPMVAWLAVEAAETAAAADPGDPRIAAWRERAATVARRLGMAGVLARAERLDRGSPRAPEPPASPPPREVAARCGFTLRREGDVWAVTHGERVFRIKDTKGMRFLARLVDEPGRELHVLDLSSPAGEAIDAGDAGPVLDGRARAEYAARVRELEEIVEEAESWNDPGRADAARAELEMLARELGRAVGMGGRARTTGAAAERARVNVQRRIRDAIRRIEEHDEPLARHLERAVRTGAFCAYDPA